LVGRLEEIAPRLGHFETVYCQMRRPRDGDSGVVEQGNYRVVDDVVMLVDKDGVPRKDAKGKPIQHKLKPGETERGVAYKLTREHIPDRRGDFHRKIQYFNVGKI
jgi:hypothetical protein